MVNKLRKNVISIVLKVYVLTRKGSVLMNNELEANQRCYNY